MFKKFINIGFMISPFFFAGACAAQNDARMKLSQTPPVEKVIAGQQCNMSNTSSALWISDKTQLISTLKQMRSHIINAKISAPKIDFNQYGIVLVWMGMQRSGGYGLEISKNPLKIVGDTAMLKLKWRKPAKGMITTQMLSNPCLMLKIKKAEFKKLQVVTLTGKKIITLEIR